MNASESSSILEALSSCLIVILRTPSTGLEVEFWERRGECGNLYARRWYIATRLKANTPEHIGTQ